MKTIFARLRGRALALPALALSLALGGCLLMDPEPPRYILLDVRWASGDSVLLYSVFDRPETPSGNPARVRLFRADVNSARQVTANTVVLSAPQTWGCADLRVKDSLVYMSYYPYPLPAQRPQHGCPNEPGPKVFAGRLGAEPMFPLPAPVDTVALRAYLHIDLERDPGLETRGSLEDSKSCIIEGPCLEDLIEAWDAAHP
jgi:hypothetical protein